MQQIKGKKDMEKKTPQRLKPARQTLDNVPMLPSVLSHGQGVYTYVQNGISQIVMTFLCVFKLGGFHQA